jgi:hypothetical protein
MKSVKILALVMLTFSANVSYGQARRVQNQDPAQQAQVGQRSDDDVLAACCSGGAQCDANSPDIKAAVDRVLGRQAAPTTTAQ